MIILYLEMVSRLVFYTILLRDLLHDMCYKYNEYYIIYTYTFTYACTGDVIQYIYLTRFKKAIQIQQKYAGG